MNFSRQWLLPRAVMSIGISTAFACSSTGLQAATTQRASYEVRGRRYHLLPSAEGYVKEGIASWYGSDFHGRPTSSGERYNMHKYTAAHKTLPLNTYLRITNLENGLVTFVRVNDRGPFLKERILDLSYAAANDLEMVQKGTAPIKIEALGADNVPLYDFYSGSFAIQIGSFRQKNNALRLMERISGIYSGAYINVFDRGADRFYQVRVGNLTTLQTARQMGKKLKDQGFSDAFAIAVEPK